MRINCLFNITVNVLQPCARFNGARVLLGGAVELCGWFCFGLSFFERWKC